MIHNIQIETNFFLRPLVVEDAKRLAQLGNNPNVAKQMTNRFPSPYKYANAHHFITAIAQKKPSQIWGMDWQGELVGVCGIYPQEDVRSPNAELGYWVAEDYWGNGIAPRAVSTLVRFSWKHWPSIERIFASVFGENKKSVRVLQKIGFEQEAIFKKAIRKNNQLQDELIFALYRPE